MKTDFSLKSFKITGKTGTISEDISDLPNGLYMYNIILNNSVIQRNTLVIMK